MILAYKVKNFDSSNRSYKYSAPPQSQRNPFLPEVTLKYRQNVQRQIDRAYSQELINVPNQSWLTNRYEISDGEIETVNFSLSMRLIHFALNNRYSQGDKIAPRSYSVNPLLGYAKLKGDLVKRQSDPEIIHLCPTQTQYIAPRAALNKDGNWMYVVNLPGQDKYSQLVKSEKCLWV